MEENSITVAILREIRDELRTTRTELNQRLDQTNERLDQTNERLDQTNERLDQTNGRLDSVVHEQIRQGTSLIEMKRLQEKLVDVAVAADGRQLAMERRLGQVVNELQKLNSRLDNVLTGPLGTYVRAHDRRIDDLEQRVEAIEHKVG
ncbi:MAG: hypothetical protein R3A48_01440 [Polyangiales bacterium]